MDEQWMHMALQLASKGLGRTSPNPVVGAVIVNNGQVAGTGFHQKAGTPHAEIHALREAGSLAQGATLYVTLEPCCHHGQTPPCTKAIIQAGIGRVVVATLDPNPLVAGKGIQQLRAAGIQVTVGVLEEEARRQNEVFMKYMTAKRPFCALKMAVTLDGKIATAGGDTRWITGPQSRTFTHRLRSRYDAILVGINTVINDDPLLTCRLEERPIQDPVRIILDSKLRISPTARVVNLSSEAPTIIVTTRHHDPEKKSLLERRGVEIIPVDDERGKVNLRSLMEVLAHRNITSVLIEGGAQVAAAFLEANLVDKLYWFMAPKIIGGQAALSSVSGQGRSQLKDAWQFEIHETNRLGDDLLMILYPRKAGDEACSPV